MCMSYQVAVVSLGKTLHLDCFSSPRCINGYMYMVYGKTRGRTNICLWGSNPPPSRQGHAKEAQPCFNDLVKDHQYEHARGPLMVVMGYDPSPVHLHKCVKKKVNRNYVILLFFLRLTINWLGGCLFLLRGGFLCHKWWFVTMVTGGYCIKINTTIFKKSNVIYFSEKDF